MRRIFYWILFGLLTGCTVGPDYHPPREKLPSNYSMIKKNFSSGGKNETQFWNVAVNDPILLDLIKQAICGHNLDIQQALANLRQARAGLRIAKADYFPQLDMNDQITRDRFSANQPLLA